MGLKFKVSTTVEAPTKQTIDLQAAEEPAAINNLLAKQEKPAVKHPTVVSFTPDRVHECVCVKKEPHMALTAQRTHASTHPKSHWRENLTNE